MFQGEFLDASLELIRFELEKIDRTPLLLFSSSFSILYELIDKIRWSCDAFRNILPQQTNEKLLNAVVEWYEYFHIE